MKYKVPCEWTMRGYLAIEADSPEEAIEKAEAEAATCPLPDNGDYLEDSFIVETNPEFVL